MKTYDCYPRDWVVDLLVELKDFIVEQFFFLIDDLKNATKKD